MNTSQKIKKILTIKLPNWLGVISYTALIITVLYFGYYLYISYAGTQFSGF